jgi:hypothetical protein
MNTTNAVRISRSVEMQTVGTPKDWGSDKLTTFLDDARGNQFASFVEAHSHYEKIRDVDAAFVTICDNLLNPSNFSAAFLLLAHASYRAAAGLALSTQSAPAFALMRQCLENSLYGLYISQHPDSFETWLKRNDDAATKQKMKDEFKIGALKEILESIDRSTHSVWSQMYEKTIDFGAHPNPAALVSAFKMHKGEKGIRFQVAYLTAEPEVIKGTMKSVAQTGLCSLLVFHDVFPERFDLLGITESIQKLRKGL